MPTSWCSLACGIGIRAVRSSDGCPRRHHGGYRETAGSSNWSAGAVSRCCAQSWHRRFVCAAVQALQPDAAAVVADVGFGGGVGLKFLLGSVGLSGRVHGVEVSDTMLSQAARRYRRDIAAGRLALHTGSLTQLPFADSALNAVLTVNTIYFIAELDRAFTELARVVGSPGRIVVGLADPAAMARMPFGPGCSAGRCRGDRHAARSGARSRAPSNQPG